MINQVTWSPGTTLETMIEQVIGAAMSFYRGNKTAVANSLGIAVRTLDNKLEKYAKESTEREVKTSHARSQREEFQRRQRATPAGAQFDTSATPIQFDPAKYRGVPTPEQHDAAGQRNGAQAQAGVRTEPAEGTPAQQPMPVSEQKEVQGVLPAEAPGNRKRANG